MDSCIRVTANLDGERCVWEAHLQWFALVLRVVSAQESGDLSLAQSLQREADALRRRLPPMPEALHRMLRDRLEAVLRERRRRN